MARPYSPWDVSVGNDRLPLLQMIARNDRRKRVALAAQPPMPQAAMTQAPMATPPAETQPIRLGPKPTAQRQAAPQPAITRRAQTPVAPEMRQQAAASQPAGVASIIQGLSPQERQQLMASTLGGAAANLSNLLAGRPNAGIGEILLATGGGSVAGRQQGEQGIRLGQQQAMRGQLLERQVASQEAKLAQEQEQAARLQALMADMPPEMQRVVAMSQAGVPAAGIEAMVPQRLTPYQEASLRLREQEIARSGAMTPYQSEMLALRRQELERGGSSEPLVEVFDPESGQVRYAPRSQAAGQQVPHPGSAEATAALRTRAGKIQSYVDQGLDQQTSMLIVDNNLDVQATADGRLVAFNPITNESRDITPSVAGTPSKLPEDPNRMTLGRAPEYGTGAASAMVDFVNRTVGQVDPSVVSAEVATARPALESLKVEARDLLSTNARALKMELESIDKIVPGPEILQSPEAAKKQLAQLRGVMIQAHNRYTDLLKSPSFTGNDRAEVEMKAARIREIVDELEPLSAAASQAGASATPQQGAPATGEYGSMGLDQLMALDPATLTPEQAAQAADALRAQMAR